MSDWVKDLGIGLSRALRYSYGGILLLILAARFGGPTVKDLRSQLDWELMALAVLVVGAGIYAVHRTVIVPLHHASLCLVWWLVDSAWGVSKEKSANPTRWLGSLKVPFWLRIPAYTALRRSGEEAGILTKEENADWNVAHAESGVVLMTAEGLLAGTILADNPDLRRTLAWAFVVLFLFSYAGFIQHAVECGRFKAKNRDKNQDKNNDPGKVRNFLEDLSMTTEDVQNPPPKWVFLLAGVLGVLVAAALVAVFFLWGGSIERWQVPFVALFGTVFAVLGMLELLPKIRTGV